MTEDVAAAKDGMEPWAYVEGTQVGYVPCASMHVYALKVTCPS